MNKLKYYILLLTTALMAVACSDDLEPEPQDVDFCVRAVWQNGLDGGKATRALSATDILADSTADIEIATADYPEIINVHCSDGNDFTLTKGSALCSDHSDYWQYTPSIIYKDKKIEHDNLTFAATATIDEGDELEGEATSANINGAHLLFTLRHTKALLRFSFKVSEKYDKIRYIKITGIKLNDTYCAVVEKVLNKDNLKLIAYAYVDPASFSLAQQNTLACTYNIYDKDEATDKHLTRKDVTATNTFKLNNLKDGSTPITELKAGYYYDLNVTINPDYLYVLSEHDNKHITID